MRRRQAAKQKKRPGSAAVAAICLVVGLEEREVVSCEDGRVGYTIGVSGTDYISLPR